jgi:hypothetical protein
MSDGMSDAARLGHQESEVKEAAHRLGVALREARDGVRGWAIKPGDLLELVNDYLGDCDVPFELRYVRSKD